MLVFHVEFFERLDAIGDKPGCHHDKILAAVAGKFAHAIRRVGALAIRARPKRD